jgi:hypothetical protein
MASQVLSGSSNPSYTNNTGQNVRVVINYMKDTILQRANTSGTIPQLDGIVITWAGVSVTQYNINAIGRNLATFSSYQDQFLTSNNQYLVGGTSAVSANNAVAKVGLLSGALPTELMLAPGQTFSATCGIYNIVVIPEAG